MNGVVLELQKEVMDKNANVAEEYRFVIRYEIKNI